MVSCFGQCERFYLLTLCLKEVNPSLAEVADVEQTVAVGCSLVRAALGMIGFPRANHLSLTNSLR